MFGQRARGAVIAAGCFLLLFCAGCAVNPVTGDSQFMLVSAEQDKKIGSRYGPEIEKQLGGKLKDVELQEYIDGVGQKVARASHRPNYGYQFAAVNDASVNAVALPGGYIYITRGMLAKLDSEAQLAGILAHETTHVVARHSAAAMSRQIGMTLLLVGAAMGGASGGQMAAADIASQIIDLRYSRADEQEADIEGVDYMVRAGYDPYGMIEVMELLQAEDKVKAVEFLSSHPIPENRRLYITAHIQTQFGDTGQLAAGKKDYRRLVLARLPAESE